MIMEEAVMASNSQVQRLMTTYPGTALLGSVGPDLLFFSPEYPEFNFVVQFAHNMKSLKNEYGKIKESIGKALEPIEQAIKDSPVPIDETITIAADILPLECLSGFVDEVKQSAETFSSALRDTLLTGIDGGIDLVSDAAGLPSFSHGIFDQLFTPGAQAGEREWDWYWFDMLHYRNSGRFAKKLLEHAQTDRQKAYALGYLTHVGADMVGHAFVNRIVCGPYRLHPQRHVIVENFIDAYQYREDRGRSVNESLYSRLIDTMAEDGTCKVDEYSGYVEGFSTEIRDLIDKAFRSSFPDTPTSQGDSKPPRPEYLSRGDITKTFENFHVTMSYLADGYVPCPNSLLDQYDDVADYLNDILSNFEAPPSPPPTGNTEFCLSWECITYAVDHIDEWMSYFKELAEWTFETIANALDLLLELFCEAALAMVRAFFYLVEYLSYQLYQQMHFLMALNGFVTPEAGQVRDDPRAETMVHTGLTGPVIASRGPITTHVPPWEATYPRRHDHNTRAIRPPDTSVELPPTGFPTVNADDYPGWYIRDAPWPDLEATIRAYAEAATPAEAQALANPNNPGRQVLGNAVELASWLMQEGLQVVEEEARTGRPNPRSPLVFCNWDLDADRGYAYKQWFAKKAPGSLAADEPVAESYLDESLSRDP